MAQPLAVVVYTSIIPGTQLVNKLQDMGYKVVTIQDPSLLPRLAEQEKPLVILADIEKHRDVCAAITELRKSPATRHIPVIAFGQEKAADAHASAHQAGATITVSNTKLLDQLGTLLDQALNVD
ncbi:MAG: hypothetical protein NZ739_00405 [Verrucomicrobiae bacterium]|nr:hypothetical protein [Verrucomicrobiae bacterium]MCX7722063.1 hypothetical protein [Verrucomicrobiae bacterium]MDW7979532.1 hypothetical protein [Verrucomicrobiales bacterium]